MVVAFTRRIKWLREEDAILQAMRARVQLNFMQGSGLEQFIHLPWLKDLVAEQELMELMGRWDPKDMEDLYLWEGLPIDRGCDSRFIWLGEGSPIKD